VVVLAAAGGNMLAAPVFVLGPAISRSDLGGAGAWALIMAIFSLGSFVGGLGVLRLRPRRPLLVGSVAVSLFALPTFLLAGRSPAVAIAAGALVAGAAVMTFTALWER
jgi:CHASE2 domain-containing sensor protein